MPTSIRRMRSTEVTGESVALALGEPRAATLFASRLLAAVALGH